jgi:alpha-D-ribose 1-methylphosphonate 5-triphosphate synthase subunit PhnG
MTMVTVHVADLVAARAALVIVADLAAARAPDVMIADLRADIGGGTTGRIQVADLTVTGASAVQAPAYKASGARQWTPLAISSSAGTGAWN